MASPHQRRARLRRPSGRRAGAFSSSSIVPARAVIRSKTRPEPHVHDSPADRCEGRPWQGGPHTLVALMSALPTEHGGRTAASPHPAKHRPHASTRRAPRVPRQPRVLQGPRSTYRGTGATSHRRCRTPLLIDRTYPRMGRASFSSRPMRPAAGPVRPARSAPCAAPAPAPCPPEAPHRAPRHCAARGRVGRRASVSRTSAAAQTVPRFHRLPSTPPLQAR